MARTMPHAMQRQIFNPRPVVLPDSKVRREPTRPFAHRPPGFEEEFDYRTLLFDSFFCGKDQVLVTAPPFLNLLVFVEKMEVTALPSGQKCTFRIRNADRHSQIRIAVPAGTQKLRLGSVTGEFELEPHRDGSGFFAGKRVLFTKSRNNRFEWIRDWIRYHRDIHSADAVLIYDNNSTDYATHDLRDALCEVTGIDRLCVVNWPFPFGPQGIGSTGFWDSDFCEQGLLEHARWMFLQQARSVLATDIDELVLSKNGSSVFEAAERSPLGVVRFQGHWVHGFEGRTRVARDDAPVRVVDFDHYLRHLPGRRLGVLPARENVCPSKWAVVPRRCPERAQWTSHRIKGWINTLPVSRNFSFRHFREISTHWKYDRSARVVLDPNLYVRDELMRANYSAVQWTS
jgi:hypothetical protein